MASKTFKVFFNKCISGQNAVPGGTTEMLTKAQAEAAHLKYGKEPVKVTGPLEEAQVLEITCENAEAAACAAVHLFGATQAEGEMTVIETANVEKKKGN
jgi:hypothetical protein